MLAPYALQAQFVADTSASQVKAFEKIINRHIRVPTRSLDSLCTAIYTTVLIKVRNGITAETLAFTGNCPPFISKNFQDSVAIFTNANWSEIFPESKGKKDFNVLLPCVFNIDNNRCYYVFSEKEIKGKINFDIDIQRQDQLAWFLLPAYRIHLYPAQR